MYSMALANPAGLQVDFFLKTFGLWFLAGLFLLLAAYGWFSMKHIRSSSRIKDAHHRELDTMNKQLRIKKIQAADEQKMVALLVAYLEKFHTKTGAHSFTSLLAWAKFSDNEIAELKAVNYGKGRLSNELKVKILKQVAQN